MSLEGELPWNALKFYDMKDMKRDYNFKSNYQKIINYLRNLDDEPLDYALIEQMIYDLDVAEKELIVRKENAESEGEYQFRLKCYEYASENNINVNLNIISLLKNKYWYNLHYSEETEYKIKNFYKLLEI